MSAGSKQKNKKFSWVLDLIDKVEYVCGVLAEVEFDFGEWCEAIVGCYLFMCLCWCVGRAF